jgi:hypothetical protein
MANGFTTEQLRLAILGPDRYCWDAFQQGQFARVTGVERGANPFYHPALPGHVNISEWTSGWDHGVPALASTAA